ncbi:hypothetical protein EV702DRAFT_757060 [Suillus placidus]|uniref:C2H2-type domain-containing protein n=1 Tax=Suillus placidus TaxID=48579 RepID=A0A9P6ZI69_9AGAM|nr:hypothetical protein EV702DRAFT_757060 [Suillus placidus]
MSLVKNYVCSAQADCNKTFIKYTDLKKHEAAHSPSAHTCDFPGCDFVTLSKPSFEIHSDKHTGKQRYSCPRGCGFKTHNPASLTRHRKIEHGHVPRPRHSRGSSRTAATSASPLTSSEPKPEPRPEPKPEPRPEPKLEPRPEPKPEPEPQPQLPRPQPQAQPQPHAQPQLPQAQLRPQPQPQLPQPQPQLPQPQPQPQPNYNHMPGAFYGGQYYAAPAGWQQHPAPYLYYQYPVCYCPNCYPMYAAPVWGANGWHVIYPYWRA